MRIAMGIPAARSTAVASPPTRNETPTAPQNPRQSSPAAGVPTTPYRRKKKDGTRMNPTRKPIAAGVLRVGAEPRPRGVPRGGGGAGAQAPPAPRPHPPQGEVEALGDVLQDDEEREREGDHEGADEGEGGCELGPQGVRGEVLPVVDEARPVADVRRGTPAPAGPDEAGGRERGARVAEGFRDDEDEPRGHAGRAHGEGDRPDRREAARPRR